MKEISREEEVHLSHLGLFVLTVEPLVTLVPLFLGLPEAGDVVQGHSDGFQRGTHSQHEILDRFGAVLVRHVDHGPPTLL